MEMLGKAGRSVPGGGGPNRKDDAWGLMGEGEGAQDVVSVHVRGGTPTRPGGYRFIRGDSIFSRLSR